MTDVVVVAGLGSTERRSDGLASPEVKETSSPLQNHLLEGEMALTTKYQRREKGTLMPIYEYKCSHCGHVSELIVGIGRNSDDLVCGSCGGSELEQLMSAPAAAVVNEPSGHAGGSTCCGSSPSHKGCVPGSCCGSS